MHGGAVRAETGEGGCGQLIKGFEHCTHEPGLDPVGKREAIEGVKAKGSHGRICSLEIPTPKTIWRRN